MIRRGFMVLVIAGLLVNLTGCATWWQKHNFVKKRRTEYLRSSAATPLQVPPGLDASGVGDDYVIPAANTPAPAQSIGIIPPDSLADKYARGVVTKAQLKAMAKALKEEEKRSATTATAQSAATGAAAVTANSNNVLPLNQTVAAAWEPVGAALKRAGYKIAWQNQNVASYYILDLYATDGRVTKTTPIYLIKLQTGADGNANAVVTDDMGNPISADIAQQVLTNLRNGLAGKGPSSSFWHMFSPVKRWAKEAF